MFYSEDLNRYFYTEEACLKAEEEYKEKHALEIKKKEERTAEAKAVEEAYKKYLELRSEFIKKHGSYHMTLTEKDLPAKTSVFDLFDWFWF